MTRRPPLSRRALLSGFGALGLGAGVALATGADGTDGPNWPMYRRDPAGTAHAPEATVPRAKPTERWTHGFDYGFRTPQPVVYDGRVFLARDSLTVLDAESGEKLYRIETGGTWPEFFSTPAVASARAYVSPCLVAASRDGLQAVGVDGGPDLPVLDGNGLARRWSTSQQPDSQILSSLGFGTGWKRSPVAADGTVFVSDDGIVATDASSGSVRWRTSTRAFLSRPAIADGSLYTVRYEGTVTEYAHDTGEQRWTAPTPAVRQEHQPTVANGAVYLAHDAGVTALDADGGDERWTSGQPAAEHGRYVTPPTVTPEAVYAAGSGLLGDEESGLVAFDAGTGDRLWDASIRKPSDDNGGPVVADGVVLLANGHDLYAFDAATGERLWRLERDAMVSQPAVVGDRFYLADGRSITAFGGA